VNRVRAHETELSYEFVGEGGPDLVVVPQWFLSSQSMRASALVRSLMRAHRVLLYDRRGTGNSDKPGAPYSTARDSRDMAGMADALDLDDFVLLGHGVRGSQVALHYAGHFPHKVRAVVCIGGTPRWNAGPEWPYGVSADQWEHAFGALLASDEPPAGASIAMRADWGACGRDAALDILQRTREEDLRAFLPKVTSPVLVIHLKGDALVPFEAAQWLADSVANGTLEEFDAPRTIPLAAHEELAAHIEEFLRAI
jgi:non-heme chloroperoxidase